jgi:hypothetical protein
MKYGIRQLKQDRWSTRRGSPNDVIGAGALDLLRKELRIKDARLAKIDRRRQR